jgi:hypothetical protein
MPTYDAQHALNDLKVVGNEKVGGSGMCHSVPI